MDEKLNAYILNCRDVSVVLKNRESKLPYIESYRLNGITYCGGRFWGKFSNVHSPVGHKKVGTFDLLSYAYNNFTPVVCTHSINSRMERFISANAYSEISFVATGDFRKIWGSEKGYSNNILQEAVLSGLKMKVKIESSDGYIYIIPVHTIVNYEDNGDFVLETEFDGFPEKLRHFTYIESIAAAFERNFKEYPQASYLHTDYEFDREFFLTYFSISKQGIKHYVRCEEGNIDPVEFDFKYYEVWIEC